MMGRAAWLPPRAGAVAAIMSGSGMGQGGRGVAMLAGRLRPSGPGFDQLRAVRSLTLAPEADQIQARGA